MYREVNTGNSTETGRLDGRGEQQVRPPVAIEVGRITVDVAGIELVKFLRFP
ncbi:MAG: hypothetical protein CM1200mP2_38410 [Planctomycetaceae bacterium]|nr:MAG: hypothetical protein CM1200mP2_38410 [Planctomycetaceae bacterium]